MSRAAPPSPSAPRRRRRIALAWGAVTFLALAALSTGPGISRDEAVAIDAAERAAAFWSDLPAHPLAELGRLDRALGGAHPPAPLGPALAAATHAAAARAGLPHRIGFRLATALAGALLSALLALLAHDLAGDGGALLAPALYWLAPRQLQLGAVATPDTLATAFWLATAMAYRRSGETPRARERVGYGLLAGLAFGGALAARLDSWVLLPALAVHAGLLRRAHRRPPSSGPARARGVPPAIGAMLVLGPLVLAALWPWLWAHPLRRLAAAATPPQAAWDYLGARLSGTRPPLLYPLAVTALSAPAALLLAWSGGLAHAAARLVWPASGERAEPADDALLLAGAAAPLVAAAAGLAPLLGGIRPWLPAFPFLAVAGARAVATAARSAWPARSGALGLVLSAALLWPGAWQVARCWPEAAASWGELAGGAPGAASLGMQRQDGGEGAAALLAELDARARPGARVLFVGPAASALRVEASDGRLRPDLALAVDPAGADLAVVALDGGSRDAEYQVWAAFRSDRPVAGAFLDEVPLAFVYARAGAWR